MTTSKAPLKPFRLANGAAVQAVDMVEGVPVDPKLPAKFDDTRNEDRGPAHQKWWDQPFIQTNTLADLDRYYESVALGHGRADWDKVGRAQWIDAWPDGTRYDVRCLDGGAWDRSTNWGSFPTLEQAVRCAHVGPNWRRRRAGE